MHVTWAIDGTSVPLEWGSAQMEAPGGYGSLSGVSVRASDLPVGAGPFSIVVGTRSDGQGFYRGEIAGVPQIYEGVASFDVQGLGDRLKRRRDRRLFQNQTVGEWVLSDADPHSGGSYQMHDLYEINVRDGAIVMVRTPGTYVTNDRASVTFWARGETINRVAFDIDRASGQPNNEIRLLTAAGPTGALTIEAPTYNLTGTTVINVDKTLDNPEDMLQIQLRADSGSSPTARARNVIRNIRVNGRTLLDTFTLSDLSADISNEMSWDDMSPANEADILPQDWLDDWHTSLTEATEVQDCIWLATEPDTFSMSDAGLYVGEWGRSAFSVHGIDYSGVQAQLPFNKAFVSYETPAGVVQVVSADADPNPHAGTGQVVAWPDDEPYELVGPRYSDAIATSLAQRLADHYSQPQVKGRLHVTKLYASDGERHPWDLAAGDLLTLSGYETAPGEAELGAQRVVTVSRSPDGTADVSVGDDETIGALVGRVARRKRKRRRRRRR